MSGISRSSRLQARIRYGSVEHARRNPACAPRPADRELRPKLKKPLLVAFLTLVEAAGIEPASKDPLQTVLHT